MAVCRCPRRALCLKNLHSAIMLRYLLGEGVICNCLSFSWEGIVPQELAFCHYVKVFVGGGGDL